MRTTLALAYLRRPAVLDALGVVYFDLGRLESALQAFAEAADPP